MAMKRTREAAEIGRAGAELDELDDWCKTELGEAGPIAAVPEAQERQIAKIRAKADAVRMRRKAEAACSLQAPTTPKESPTPKSLQFVEAWVPGVRTMVYGHSIPLASAAQPQLSRFAIKSSGSSAAQPKPRAESSGSSAAQPKPRAASSGSSAAPQAKLVTTSKAAQRPAAKAAQLVKTSKASQLPPAKAAQPKHTSAAMAAKPWMTISKDEVKDEVKDEDLKDEVKDEAKWYREQDEAKDEQEQLVVEEQAAATPMRITPPWNAWRQQAPAYSPMPPPTCAAPAQVEPQPLGAPPPPPIGAPPPPPQPPHGPPPPHLLQRVGGGPPPAPPPGPPPPDPAPPPGPAPPPPPPSQGPPPPHNFRHGPPPLPPPQAPAHAEPRAKGRFPGDRGGAFAKYWTAHHQAKRLGSYHMELWTMINPKPNTKAEARVWEESSI